MIRRQPDDPGSMPARYHPPGGSQAYRPYADRERSGSVLGGILMCWLYCLLGFVCGAAMVLFSIGAFE